MGRKIARIGMKCALDGVPCNKREMVLRLELHTIGIKCALDDIHKKRTMTAQKAQCLWHKKLGASYQSSNDSNV
jgi:hypothetical protein